MKTKKIHQMKSAKKPVSQKTSTALSFVLFAGVTILLGMFAGAFTWVFFFLMNTGIDVLWVRIPAWLSALGLPAHYYPVLFCLIGGVCLGVFRKRFGSYPPDMQEVMQEVKETGRMDYSHIGASFFGALLPLLFGGSIGPEAGLTGVIAGLCSWVGDKLHFFRAELCDAALSGLSAVLSVTFSTPLFGLVAPLIDNEASTPKDLPAHDMPRGRKIVVYTLATVAALVSFGGLGALFGGGMTLPRFTGFAFSFTPSECAGIILAVALGICGGYLYYGSASFFRAVAARLKKRDILQAVLAGGILGCVGLFLPFTMFAGEVQA